MQLLVRMSVEDLSIKTILRFIQREMVLSVAGILAILSMFVVKPTEKYLQYIDFRVLSLLFCLMVIILGLRQEGVFDKIIKILLRLVKNTMQLSMILVVACFLSSMWITNDVALITFVPLTIMITNKIKEQGITIKVIVMQTIAANLGSMVTPIGNPQNLYLFSMSTMSIKSFFITMAPYTIVSLVLIVLIVSLIIPRKTILCNLDSHNKLEATCDIGKVIVYIGLFLLCLITVLHIIDYRITLAIVILVIAIAERKLFAGVDYMLLLTFVMFFIFVGNIRNIPLVSEFLMRIVKGNEVIVSVLSSQVISNVPVAVLLSGFTENYNALLIGTNIGGLGTLIASMASLISYKLYCNSENCNKKKYFIKFTFYNVIFLVVLSIVYIFKLVWF